MSDPYARGGTASKVTFARGLRRRPTAAERALWEHLRGRNLDGLKFRRQHLLLGYVADFYCPEVRLVIELDGPSHAGRERYDRERSQAFESFGVAVIRFADEEVIGNVITVLERIAVAASRLPR